MEVQKKKQEDKLERQLAINKKDKATEVPFIIFFLAVVFTFTETSLVYFEIFLFLGDKSS